MKFKVLIACRSDKTGKAYEPGEIIPARAFPPAVVADWLKTVPPVLEPVEEEEKDGSDA